MIKVVVFASFPKCNPKNIAGTALHTESQRKMVEMQQKGVALGPLQVGLYLLSAHRSNRTENRAQHATQDNQYRQDTNQNLGHNNFSLFKLSH